MTISKKLLGRILRNCRAFNEFKEIGYDYIVNPVTHELHYVHTENFFGSHNLTHANLEEFIGIFNIGSIPIHWFEDDTIIPIVDLDELSEIYEYPLNKCAHCDFP